jgi:hypothetical protein
MVAINNTAGFKHYLCILLSRHKELGIMGMTWLYFSASWPTHWKLAAQDYENVASSPALFSAFAFPNIKQKC